MEVRVHNITDRPNTEEAPHALRIGTFLLRPGKFIEIDDSVLNSKHRALHGNSLWIGNLLPPRYQATSKSALDIVDSSVGLAPMTIEEARTYLLDVPKETALALCNSMTPPLVFRQEPSHKMLAVKLSRSLFTGDRILDPEAFFWLRRWTNKGDTYTER